MFYHPSKWKTYKLLRERLLEVVIAWMMFTVIVLLYNHFQSLARENAPVTEYFEVRQIAVPDHIVGTNPEIIYDRSVNKSFSGRYTVEVQEAGTLQALTKCTGSEEANYTPEKQLPEGGATLFWFIGKECLIPPGSYRLEACWEVRREKASTIHYCRASAIFNVIDVQKSLEQSQQLPTQQ
jgi:hypothetical protein